ncbi:hypothetical protein [Pseudomonas auratipiscis]|uniref:Uncharacterized protein n=1 Tax=Pseudomonas auratipiscis TaxID=3115853 RepID=A0AB35WQN7_9PSED|nr:MULTISPECIES: hypothetical protein [unclassified Pseudomonas]MEE1866732.1 hypothetical protein [Pseudomonas sp. 120P]MEE1958628.1 hypothetical protein [Pseudomonas sp. 119P]
MKSEALKPVFFGPRIMTLSLLSYVAILAVGMVISHSASSESLAWPFTVAMTAALWWLLQGPRLCNLTVNMIALQVPGVHLTLLRGVALHMALSIGPTLAFLLLWPPTNDNTLQLAAALWLGSCYGLWFISMPGALNIIPMALLGLYWPVVADPVLCTLLGLLLLALSAALWHWQIVRPRTRFLSPLGVALDEHLLSLSGSARERFAPVAGMSSRSTTTPNRLSQDRVAVILGLQTIRQTYGKRRQYWTYLAFACALASLYAFQANFSGVYLSMWVAVILIWVPLRTLRNLTGLHGQHSAPLADLLLTPGLPPREHLQASVMRQLRDRLLEQLTLLTLVLMAMAASNNDPGLHQPLPAITFSCLMFVVTLGLARLAWRGALSRRQLTLGTIAAMVAVYVGTIWVNIS